MQNINNSVMIDHIKGLLKVKFQKDYLLFRLVALIDILISPSQAILNTPVIKETILVFMDHTQNHFLKSVGKEFGGYLECAVEE